MTDDGYVRVGALRVALAGLPDDMLVVLSRDGEGNGFSPLSEAVTENHHYLPESTWDGIVPHPDDFANGEYDTEGAEPCVVLWPTN